MEKIKVLIVEDNPGDLRLIQELLAENQNVRFVTDNCTTVTAALEKLPDNYEVVLLDLNLPDSVGLDTFDKMKRIDLPIIILTGIDDLEIARKAVREGTQDYLEKPNLTSDKLCKSIFYAIERHMRLKLQLTNIRLIKQYMDGISNNVEDVIKKINNLLSSYS